MNKISGGDGTPTELFQILKDDALKWAALNMSANLEKLISGHTRKGLILIPMKGNVKACSNYSTTMVSSHARKVVFNILHTRLYQHMN